MDSRIEVAHNWFAVELVAVAMVAAIVAVDIADMGLVVVALFNPPKAHSIKS